MVLKEERRGVKRQIQVVVPEVGVVVALQCEAAVCTWIRVLLPSWPPQGYLSRRTREMKINAQIRHTAAHVLAPFFLVAVFLSHSPSAASWEGLKCSVVSNQG